MQEKDYAGCVYSRRQQWSLGKLNRKELLLDGEKKLLIENDNLPTPCPRKVSQELVSKHAKLIKDAAEAGVYPILSLDKRYLNNTAYLRFSRFLRGKYPGPRTTPFRGELELLESLRRRYEKGETIAAVSKTYGLAIRNNYEMYKVKSIQVKEENVSSDAQEIRAQNMESNKKEKELAQWYKRAQWRKSAYAAGRIKKLYPGEKYLIDKVNRNSGAPKTKTYWEYAALLEKACSVGACEFEPKETVTAPKPTLTVFPEVEPAKFQFIQVDDGAKPINVPIRLEITIKVKLETE